MFKVEIYISNITKITKFYKNHKIYQNLTKIIKFYKNHRTLQYNSFDMALHNTHSFYPHPLPWNLHKSDRVAF